MFVDTYFGEARLPIPKSFLVEIRKNRGIIRRGIRSPKNSFVHDRLEVASVLLTQLTKHVESTLLQGWT
jgi:hypothetical protein